MWHLEGVGSRQKDTAGHAGWFGASCLNRNNETRHRFFGDTLDTSDFTTNQCREIRQDAATKKFGGLVPNLAVMPYNLEMTL